jgi:Tfp pilus assembly protein FimV
LLVALVVGGGIAPSAATADPADHLTGLPLPDRAATSGPPAPRAPHIPPVSDASETHVVSPGDTLWSIAGARLPATTTDAEVAEAVVRWHTTNRAVIGADPDLLRPGQVLTPPQEPAS